MGNVISDETTGEILTNTVLGNYINNWAQNNDFVGLGNASNYTLKKRACCTKQSAIPIGLPYYNATQTNPVGLSSVYINVFDSVSDITQANCTFPYTDSSGVVQQPYYTTTISQNGFNEQTDGQSFCTSFYTNPNNNSANVNLCGWVKNARSNYTEQSSNYYGPNQDDTIGQYNNTYLDCNCYNSLLNDPTVISSTEGISGLEMAESLDQRCYGYGQYLFVQKDNKTPLCLNSIDIQGNVSVSKGSNFDINQSSTCNSQTNNSTYQAQPGSSTSGVMSQSTPSAPVPASSNNTTNNTTSSNSTQGSSTPVSTSTTVSSSSTPSTPSSSTPTPSTPSSSTPTTSSSSTSSTPSTPSSSTPSTPSSSTPTTSTSSTPSTPSSPTPSSSTPASTSKLTLTKNLIIIISVVGGVLFLTIVIIIIRVMQPKNINLSVKKQ